MFKFKDPDGWDEDMELFYRIAVMFTVVASIVAVCITCVTIFA